MHQTFEIHCGAHLKYENVLITVAFEVCVMTGLSVHLFGISGSFMEAARFALIICAQQNMHHSVIPRVFSVKFPV